MAPWNPLTLTCSNPESERAYVAESATARVGLDACGLCACLVLGQIPLEGDTGGPYAMRQLCSCLNAILCYLSIRRSATYISWRDFVIFLLSLLGMTYLCVREPILAPPIPELGWILSRLFKSPVISGIFHVLVFPLRFRQQVLVNLFYIVGMILWSTKFCQSCAAGGEDLSSIFEVLGGFNMNLVSIISLNGIGAFMPKHDCFSVVMFFELLIGLLIPLYFLYNNEVSSRAAFLSRNAGEVERIRILNLKRDCQRWSVWVFMGLLILAGIVCR